MDSSSSTGSYLRAKCLTGREGCTAKEIWDECEVGCDSALKAFLWRALRRQRNYVFCRKTAVARPGSQRGAIKGEKNCKAENWEVGRDKGGKEMRAHACTTTVDSTRGQPALWPPAIDPVYSLPYALAARASKRRGVGLPVSGCVGQRHGYRYVRVGACKAFPLSPLLLPPWRPIDSSPSAPRQLPKTTVFAPWAPCTPWTCPKRPTGRRSWRSWPRQRRGG